MNISGNQGLEALRIFDTTEEPQPRQLPTSLGSSRSNNPVNQGGVTSEVYNDSIEINVQSAEGEGIDSMQTLEQMPEMPQSCKVMISENHLRSQKLLMSHFGD